MKMKCIGGMCHGQSTEVESYYKLGDQIQVMGKFEFTVPDFAEEVKNWREGKVPDYMSVPYHYYKIEVLHFSKEEYIKFLIPVDWTSKQALSLLLLPCS